MKKSSLTTAVLAGLAGVVGFAGSSNAVELNPDGTGEVLIYPYYTVNGGQQTLISVVNSTAQGKAVKVRFLEGYNSREVLDFNLFLSPYDVWTATVFALDDAGLGSTGGAVGTTDNSCTVPAFDGSGTGQGTTASGMNYVAFKNLAYIAPVSDTGPTDINRTREGYVELISMSDVDNVNGTLSAITHDPTGVPPGCGSGLLRDIANTDFVAPTGGLFGAGSIVDVTDGVNFGYVADAVDGFSAVSKFSASGDLDPNLTDANSMGAGVPIGGARAYVFENGNLITATYPAGQTVDAVSAVFQASAVLNEWVADGTFGTDWVVTFPTKRFYVDPGEGLAAAIPPFVELFGETSDGQSCTEVGVTIYNREEGADVPDVEDDFSPRPPGTPPSSLCHEVNIITITGDEGESGSVLGSSYDTLAVNVDSFGPAGWMRLDLDPSGESHQMRPSLEGVVFSGLPTTGFEALKAVNSNIGGGILANYSGAYRHRIERNVSAVIS